MVILMAARSIMSGPCMATLGFAPQPTEVNRLISKAMLPEEPSDRRARRRSRRMRACSSGPLGGGEGWADQPAGKPAWRPACFSTVHGGTVEKPRPPFTDLAGMDARQAPPRGALLFGYFLLGTQEKVTRPDRAESAADNRHASRNAQAWQRWGLHLNPNPHKETPREVGPSPQPSPQRGEGVKRASAFHRFQPNPSPFCNDTKSFNNSACPATTFCCAENCARCVSNRSISDEAPAS